MPPFLISTLISMIAGLGLEIIGHLLMPKSKTDKAEVQDMENPTAEAGRPIPVIFGEVEITGVNIIWYGEKETHTYDI